MGHTQNKPASPGDILHIANIASARLCKILANDPNFTTEKSDAILRKKGGRKEIHDLVDELAERFIGIHLNPYLKLNHRDDEATAYEMYGPNACFEELFGSLCGHIKQDDVNGIPVLVKKLKEHNLVFSSKKAGVDCITSGVESGVYKKGFIYFFA